MRQSVVEEDRWDLVAFALLAAALLVASLYPSTFIIGFPLLDSHYREPLSLLLPFFAAGAAIYLVVKRKGLALGFLGGAVLVFFLYLLFRNLIVGNEQMQVTKYVIFGLGIFFLTSLLVSRGGSARRRIVMLAVLLTLGTALYGFLEYGLQQNILFYSYIYQTVREPTHGGLHRVGSTLAHPVVFGAFLVQALPFCLLLALTGLKRWQKAAGWAAVLAGSLALFLTYSKGSWIVVTAAGLGAFIIFWLQKGSRILLPLLLVVIGLAMLTGVFWEGLRTETVTRAGSSVVARRAEWVGALRGIRDYPVFGVGFRRGQVELSRTMDRIWLQTPGYQPVVDNNYLSIMLEEGTVGILLWILVMIAMIREGVRAALPDWSQRALAVAALFSVAGLLMNMFTFESQLIWPNFFFFWIAAGIIHGLNLQRRKAAPAIGGSLAHEA